MDTSVFTPILGHVAGLPVEETLPGVLAVGAVGARLATEWIRRQLRRPAMRNKVSQSERPR